MSAFAWGVIVTLAAIGGAGVLFVIGSVLLVIFAHDQEGWRQCPMCGRRWDYVSTWQGWVTRRQSNWHIRRNHREENDAWKRDYAEGGITLALDRRLERQRVHKAAP